MDGGEEPIWEKRHWSYVNVTQLDELLLKDPGKSFYILHFMFSYKFFWRKLKMDLESTVISQRI